MKTPPHFLCNSKGMYCEHKAIFISIQEWKFPSFILWENGFFFFSIRTKRSAGIRKTYFACLKTYIKMILQLDIVVPVIINDCKSFLDELYQFTLLNMPKMHVGILLDRESVKTRSLWSMKTWHMRGPVGFGCAIASNWCTKELQEVWQPETQTSVSREAWKCLRCAISPD